MEGRDTFHQWHVNFLFKFLSHFQTVLSPLLPLHQLSLYGNAAMHVISEKTQFGVTVPLAFTTSVASLQLHLAGASGQRGNLLAKQKWQAAESGNIVWYVALVPPHLHWTHSAHSKWKGMQGEPSGTTALCWSLSTYYRVIRGADYSGNEIGVWEKWQATNVRYGKPTWGTLKKVVCLPLNSTLSLSPSLRTF